MQMRERGGEGTLILLMRETESAQRVLLWKPITSRKYSRMRWRRQWVSGSVVTSSVEGTSAV